MAQQVQILASNQILDPMNSGIFMPWWKPVSHGKKKGGQYLFGFFGEVWEKSRCFLEISFYVDTLSILLYGLWRLVFLIYVVIFFWQTIFFILNVHVMGDGISRTLLFLEGL